MKISRTLLVWATLAVCGAMVLGAMTWLTRSVLAAEKERMEAESRADLEERTRLALWRMDALGAAIVLGENRRPAADYEPGSIAFQAAGEPLVKLHFELREFGKLAAPDSPSKSEHFENLRNLLASTPLPGDDWSVLTCAAEVGESNWKSMPKEALKPQLDNRIILQQKGGIEARKDTAYQTNFNRSELAQRANTVEATVTASDQDPLGIMRAAWVGGELFLLRQLAATSPSGNEKRVQGVWLDHEFLKRRLLTEVKDLLPDANLTAILETATDPLALVSFPFHLHRNETPPAGAASAGGPLVVGWVAVLLAILTTSVLVHGVMRLSERRASFVSAVTHELRTPLTTFRLYSEMLESGAVKEEKRGDYLRVLSREADRLTHLVENVLSFSQIERGSARSVIRESSVADLLELIRERLDARLATAGLGLEIGNARDFHVRVDTAAVEHILFNLIDNAAKYAAAGDPPTVRIDVASSGRWVDLRVSDHGPGIPVSEHRRIFRAFHKSAREAAESRPGVGLGLALSRRLAKSLGGGLECVDSKSGACFVLRLPLV